MGTLPKDELQGYTTNISLKLLEKALGQSVDIVLTGRKISTCSEEEKNILNKLSEMSGEEQLKVGKEYIGYILKGSQVYHVTGNQHTVIMMANHRHGVATGIRLVEQEDGTMLNQFLDAFKPEDYYLIPAFMPTDPKSIEEVDKLIFSQTPVGLLEPKFRS